MADTKYIGQNYTPPDLVAKVTGRARWAEDFRAEGMLFAKLLVSPMPHARVRSIDTSAALAMPGVKALLTAEDLPDLGPNVERALTNEPFYAGEPILAVAAVDELTAAEAVERINVDLEPLPFTVDPLEALRPDGPSARTTGNVWGAPMPGGVGPNAASPLKTIKWTAEQFADAEEGRLPMGEPTEQWSYGDVDAGFKTADLVLDETFVVQSTGHHPMETRTAMAYWQNGKLYIHCSTQSVAQTVPAVARWCGIEPTQVVLISEYTGGGFGSKIPGAISMAIPALLSKKLNGAPVMMRISREEEHFIGRARPAIHARVKLGMRKDGRITAVDVYTICDNGPYDAQGDGRTVPTIASVAYQPDAMRFRGVTVLTNTPPRTSQRAPGGMQSIAIMEPVIAKAARKLGLDQVAVRRINAPQGQAPVGPAGPNGERPHVTSAYVKDAIDRGAELFGWEARKATVSGKRRGSKARGIGVAVSPYSAGSIGYDGLFVIKPDGHLYAQSGIGNHGTESVIDVHRVAAETVGIPWEKVHVTWGNTAKYLPYTCSSGGSQTTHAMTRAAYAAATDAVRKLQEIAAKDLGGKPEDYVVANERVARKGGGAGLSLAQAAKRALDLGGKYDGHEVPENVNPYTKRSAAALVGQGLMGVGKDDYGRKGQTMSYVVGFAEVEVDTETGKWELVHYAAVADVGTVLHPQSLGGQIFGGGMLGFGHAHAQKWVYDQHYGAALAKRFYQNRPPTILDAPQTYAWDAVNKPDPETPVGIRGIGEPPVGAAYGAVLNALADALGDEVFRRSPVSSDDVLTALEAGHVTQERLTANV
jgi:CO/xanthine dehydrogenase Mo-binding subunit